MDDLDYLLDDLYLIPRMALATYRGYPASILIEHSLRTAATCVYDHMVAETDRRLLILADVRPLEIRGSSCG